MTRTTITCLLAIALPSVGAAAEDAVGGYWPQFHGPRRDNISTETGLLKQWPEGGPKLLWKFAECGRGYAGVSIVDGKVFTSGDFGDTEFILALGLDGKLQWKVPNGKSWRGSTPGSRATPTWSDGVLYHLSPTGRLAAVRADSGKEVWAVDLVKTYGARYGGWALSENVLVEGDVVLCAAGGEEARIIALDKGTGKLVWANRTVKDGLAYSSPIIVTHKGVRQYIALLRRTVVSIDVRTGRLLWSHEHPNRYNQNATRPVFYDGRVFVTSGHRAGGRMLKIREKSDGVVEEWFSEDFDNCHGGVLVLGDYLYGSGCRLYHKGLLCVDARTGKTRYRAEVLGKVSPTFADGMVYCVDQEGNVSLVQADPKQAVIKGRFRIPWESKDHSLAHPVVCGGRLYIRHAHNLFVYDVRRGGAGE